MARDPSHPAAEQIDAPNLLNCLSEPVRLAIVLTLAGANGPEGELRCGDFNHLSSKSNLSYHMVKLRDAGLIRSRMTGSNHFVQLRRTELEERFPGLLQAVLNAAGRSPSVMRLLSDPVPFNMDGAQED